MSSICAPWLGLSEGGGGGGGNGCTDHYINITSTLKAACLPLYDSFCLCCSPPDNTPVPSSTRTLRPKNNKKFTLKDVCSEISQFSLISYNNQKMKNKGIREKSTKLNFSILNYAKRHTFQGLLMPILTCWVEKLDSSTAVNSAKSCYLCVCVCVYWCNTKPTRFMRKKWKKCIMLLTVVPFFDLFFQLLF